MVFNYDILSFLKFEDSLGEALAKGNIWAGAATGFVVSFFNHLGGQIQKKNYFKKAVEDVSELFNNLDPNAKPDFSNGGIQTLIDDVTGLRGAHDSGEKGLKIIPDKNMKDVGLTPGNGEVKINPTKIKSNAHLAVVLFHEFRHSWQFQSGLYGYWGSKNNYSIANKLMERDAYWYQINRIGGGSYNEARMRFSDYKQATGWIKENYIPQEYIKTWKGY